jgi:SAM-dependent methyltransferase
MFSQLFFRLTNNSFINRVLVALRLDGLMADKLGIYKRVKIDTSLSPQEMAGFSMRPDVLEALDKTHMDVIATAKAYIKPGDSILDIGCGPGAYLVDFAGEYDLTGIDLNREMIEKCRENVPDAEVILDDFISHNFNKKFNYIYSVSVLEFIPPGRLEAFFEKVSSLLLPGGVFLLHYPHALSRESLSYPDLYYIEYSPRKVEETARKHLDVIEHHHAFDGRVVSSYDPQPYDPGTRTFKNGYLLIAGGKTEVKPSSLMKKRLLFTFDYELFLGMRSGTVQECMIEPTEKLIEMFDVFGVVAVFFIDTTFLLRLRDMCVNNLPSCKDYEAISAQLRKLVSKGHYIYPHIHPHWLDAEYLPDINQWKLTTVNRYRFHNITEEERDALFRGSLEILSEIIRPEHPEYQIDGFRAGGWSLQPFSDFKPYFERYGITYDFSVLPGTYQFSNAQHFDFTLAPHKPVYRFENDVNKEERNGRFIELVSSIIHISRSVNFLHRLQLRWLYRIAKDHTYGRGQGQRSVDITNVQPASQNGSSIRDPRNQPVSIETLSMVKLPVYLRYMRNHSYMQFVSHPKMLSHHSVRTLNRFLRIVTRKYDVEFDFKTFINSASELY